MQIGQDQKTNGLWDKGITLKAGQCPVHPILDKFLDHIETGQVKLEDIITHELSLKDVAEG